MNRNPNQEKMALLNRNVPFLKEFAKKYPHFYDHPLFEEAEGEAFITTLRAEYKQHDNVTDPMPELTLNILENQVIPAGQNAVIHPLFHGVPAIMHYTDYFDVKYVSSGSATYYSSDHVLQLHEGDVIITPPRSRQCLQQEEDAVVYNILIRASTFDTSFFNLVNQDDFLADFFSRALYSNASNYILWHCQANQALKKLIVRCSQEFYSNNLYNNRMVEVLIMEMFIILLRDELSLGLLPEVPSPNAHETIHILTKYLDSHGADASLHQAALMCNYSDRQLERIIKEETGLSFTQLRQRIRLNKACAMLKNPSIQIKEIARALGFVDESYFSKIFRNEYSLTPSEYRKQILDSN